MKDPLHLSEFKIPLGKLAPQEVFSTRGGEKLSYRIYPAWSENLIFLYHGIGSDSRYLCVLASQWAQENLGSVVTPDLRGHGVSFGSSDKISATQLEEDHEELLIHLRMRKAFTRIFVAGHSLGGGFALRLLSSDLSGSFSGGMALAPYLPESFGVHRANYGEWISRDDEQQIQVHRPELFRSGQEKLLYSSSYMRAVSPSEDFLQRLNPQAEILLLCGDRDQVFQPEKYQEVFSKIPNIKVMTVAGANHYSLIMASPYVQQISQSLKEKFNFFS